MGLSEAWCLLMPLAAVELTATVSPGALPPAL